MNSALVTVLTFCAAALLVGATAMMVYDLVFRYRMQINQRLDELSGKSRGATTSLFKDLKQQDVKTSSMFADLRAQLQETLEQSGLSIAPRKLAIISLCLGGGLAAIIAIACHRWWMAPVGLVPGLIAPWIYVRVRRTRRLRRLALQLPEAFDVLGRAVHAGQTVSAALQIIADDFESPISEEFRRCYEQQNLGMPYEVALRDLARRTGIMELRILVVALLVQSRSGGNMMELLNNLSTMVRKRLQLQMKVKALTGEGRMQANVLFALPLVAFAIILVLSPDYASSLLHRPWLLAATAAAQLTGALWIRRITSFEF